MPGGRRKSRNPQKWEEHDSEVLDENQFYSDELSDICASNNGGTSETPSFSQRKEINTSMNCNNRLLPSSYNRGNSQSMHNTVILKGERPSLMSNHQKSNPVVNSSNQLIMTEEKGENEKGPSASSNEMTVQEVLRSAKPGKFADCNVCNIRLKDWESTVCHIQTHRHSFLPNCVLQDKQTLLKQSVSCLVCQKVLKNITELISHVRTSHDVTKSPFLCPFCGKDLESMTHLQMHIDIQDVTMRCPVCSAACNQEFKLYAHLSECLTTFHPHLSYLICHVCNKKIKMDDLAEHMIQHSFHGSDPKTSNSRKQININNFKAEISNISKEKELKEEPAMFLCEVCDERYSSFHHFKNHLNKHSESKKFCPLCYLKGFSRADFVVRHLMLRCPRRNPEQFAFGSIITSIGKYHNHHFLEVLKDIQSAYPFHEGLEAWTSVAAVLDFLNSFKSFSKEELRQLPELSSAFPTGEALKNPTDIELLVWLTEFEKEMHAAAQGQTNSEEKQESSSFRALSIPPKDLSEFERTILNENLNYVLKKDKRGMPMEFNFESIDGQVTITPHTQDEDSVNLRQKLIDHRPSVDSLKKSFPGMCFLPEVQTSTLKRLNDEAMKLVQVNPVEEHIKKGGPVTAEDFDRLDWEAQYLRSKEQFYVKTEERVRQFSPLYKNKNKTPPAVVDEKILLNLREEAQLLAGETLHSKVKKMKGISLTEKDVERLMKESKDV